MNFRLFLIVMSLTTTAAWIGWIIVLESIDPSRSGSLGFVLFYLTLTSALIGTFSIAGVLGRIWRKQDELLVRICAKAFRQSILLTSIFIGALFLSGFGLFRWWSVLLLLMIISFVELIFLTIRKGGIEHKKYPTES